MPGVLVFPLEFQQHGVMNVHANLEHLHQPIQHVGILDRKERNCLAGQRASRLNSKIGARREYGRDGRASHVRLFVPMW